MYVIIRTKFNVVDCLIKQGWVFMQKNIFSPKISNQSADEDKIKKFLQNSAKTVLLSVFVLLPIFFIPNSFTALNFTKSYFVIIGVLLAIVFLSLSVLRSGKIKISFPIALSLFWAFVLTGLVSALLSHDVSDAVYGNILEIHTAGFFILMALIMTVSLALSDSKIAIIRLFIGLGASALILQFYHVLRLVFGPEFLSFGMFTANSSSLIGSFNDLALFSGLVIIVTIVVMQQITMGTIGKIISSLLVVTSLVLLGVINFFAVWMVVGFFALLALLYILARDTWFRGFEEKKVPVSKTVLGLIITTCIFSVSFISAGEHIGATVSNVTNISYLEVRPSMGATFDIAGSVYSQNVLLGIGPNRFEDAWRLYKDPVINETLFWNTSFNAGSGFVPTVFVNTGVVGGGMLLLFVFALLYISYRLFLLLKTSGGVWCFLGTIAIVSAIYLWIMSFFYVPGTVIMLLTALMTGVVFAVYNTVKTNNGYVIDVLRGKQYGVFLIVGVLLVVVSSTLVFITLSKNYVSQTVYAEAVRQFNTEQDFAQFDNKLTRAEELNEIDSYVAERARLRLVEVNRLSGINEPNQNDVKNFQTALVEGISLAEKTIVLDPTNPFNHILLASFYSFLNPEQYEGVQEKKDSAINTAHLLDPTNPEIYLLEAQFHARFNNLDKTRAGLIEALRLKKNYTDALFLLTQLDIQEGNSQAAIENTKAIISIEPRNPIRYFQLGVLLSTVQDIKGAIAAFEAAVVLDNNYANARYFLALSYLDDGRPEDALAQLKIVEQSNQDNLELKNLITQIEDGTFEELKTGLDNPVNDESSVVVDGDVVTTSVLPDTDLVTPVNQVESSSDEVEDGVIDNIISDDTETTNGTDTVQSELE